MKFFVFVMVLLCVPLTMGSSRSAFSLSAFSPLIGDEGGSKEVQEQLWKIPKKFFSVLEESNFDVHVLVSSYSLDEEIQRHEEIPFDLKLFTFDGWDDYSFNHPIQTLGKVYSYAYYKDSLIVVFLGPQKSSSYNVPAHELGHALSYIWGRVSQDPEWMAISRKIWREQKGMNSYFLPTRQNAGESPEISASEELFAESIAAITETKLRDFVGDDNAVLIRNYINKKTN